VSAPSLDHPAADTDPGDVMAVVTPAAIARLHTWAEQMQGDIVLADAKASTLLGWSGTALAVVSTVLVSTDAGAIRPAGWAGLVGVVGLSCLAWCVVLLVLVIRPRLGGTVLGGYSYNTEDRGFIAFAHVGPAFLVEAATADTEAGADPRQMVRRVELLARIALVKHRLIRTACTLLVLSMPLLGAATVGVLTARSGGAL
jgi:hypothetical protein